MLNIKEIKDFIEKILGASSSLASTWTPSWNERAKTFREKCYELSNNISIYCKNTPTKANLKKLNIDLIDIVASGKDIIKDYGSTYPKLNDVFVSFDKKLALDYLDVSEKENHAEEKENDLNILYSTINKLERNKGKSDGASETNKKRADDFELKFNKSISFFSQLYNTTEILAIRAEEPAPLVAHMVNVVRNAYLFFKLGDDNARKPVIDIPKNSDIPKKTGTN